MLHVHRIAHSCAQNDLFENVLAPNVNINPHLGSHKDVTNTVLKQNHITLAQNYTQKIKVITCKFKLHHHDVCNKVVDLKKGVILNSRQLG